MTGTPAQPVRQPLTAAMIRNLGKTPVAARKDVLGLAAALAEALAEVLQSYGGAPVKAVAEGTGAEAAALPLAEAAAIDMVCGGGPLTAFLSTDRMLVMALCEMAFGGSGTEPVDAVEDRPYSKTEQRLRSAMLDEFGTRLAGLFGKGLGQEFRPLGEEDGRLAAWPEEPVPVLVMRLLVNIFSYSGELRLTLSEAQLERIVGGPGGSASHSAPAGADAFSQFRAALAESPLDIAVLLPPEQMAFGTVAALRKGQLITFQADAHTPFLIASEGEVLQRARLSAAEANVCLEIIGP